jgi:hypothetical protein
MYFSLSTSDRTNYTYENVFQVLRHLSDSNPRMTFIRYKQTGGYVCIPLVSFPRHQMPLRYNPSNA